MASVSELQQILDTTRQTKETITSIVGGLSDTAKGPKGMIMKTAQEAVKKAKVKMQLEIEYTKELILLISKEIEYQAVVTAQQTALDMANQAVQMAQDEVDKCRADFEAIKKMISKKNRKARHGGESASDEDKNKFEKAKKSLDKAQEDLNKAKDGLKVAEESLDENKSTLAAIEKEIAKIKVAMTGEIPQIPSGAPSVPSTDSVSTSQNTSQPAQTQNAPAPEPSLSEEEIEEAKKMGKEREAAMEEQISNLDPVLERMDAEWMIIENGMNVLQSLSAPLTQAAALPAFVGTGAPNTAFNFAVSGCIGLLAMFVLSEINAAVVRWCSLAKENEIQPEPDKLAKIEAITAFKASIPSCCAGGAGYVSAVAAQM